MCCSCYCWARRGSDDDEGCREESMDVSWVLKLAEWLYVRTRQTEAREIVMMMYFL